MSELVSENVNDTTDGSMRAQTIDASIDARTAPTRARVGRGILVTVAVLASLPGQALRAQDTPSSIAVHSATPLIRGVDSSVDLELEALDRERRLVGTFSRTLEVRGVLRDGAPVERVELIDGRARVEGVHVPTGEVTISFDDVAFSQRLHSIPGWSTLLPAFFAIALALLTRQVLLSLFAGVFVGALLVHGYDPLTALLRTVDTYLVGSLADPDHASIILFSLSLAGMVGVITRTGGVRGIVELVARLARGPRSAQAATGLLGCLIFFDDYANSLIVGSTMRPFTDRARVSREKLAYIVDSTAAPVATIGVISTWTAYQLGLLADLPGTTRELVGQPYWFFLRSIPYSLYSFAAVALVFLSGLALRDLGAMRRAERRCHESGEVLRPGAVPLTDARLDDLAEREGVRPRWLLAALPIAAVIGFTLLGLWKTGTDAAGADAPLHDVIGNANSYQALLWGSLGASVLAIVLGRTSGVRVGELIDAWVEGAKSLVLAVIILLLAWSISTVSKETHAGDYIASIASGHLAPSLVPLVAFLTAGVIAFATGTSYGTMGILVPILLPLVFDLSSESGVDAEHAQTLALATLAAVLGGAVFGDHCSPISDTTVLSSMASGSDHVDHVRTQLPYALLGASASAIGYVAIGLGTPVAIVLPVSLALAIGAFWMLSRPSRT